MTLEAILEATNKAWVLGSDQFKRRIAKQLNRPMISAGHGGDRRSEAYLRAANNQEVRPFVLTNCFYRVINWTAMMTLLTLGVTLHGDVVVRRDLLIRFGCRWLWNTIRQDVDSQR